MCIHPIRTLVTLCVALCVIGLMPLRASAWGKEGHQIVSEIAFWRLKQLKAQNALKNIDKILKAKLTKPMPFRPRRFYEAAIWPDDIRNEASYQFAKPLHYVSIVLDKTNDPNDLDKYDAARDCKPSQQVSEGVCIIGGLEHYSNVLSTTSSRRARLEALSFVVHFLGDMHQPLHASEDIAFVNHKQGTGDVGGNFRFIFYLSDGPFDSNNVDACLSAPNACTSSFIDDNGVEKRSNKNLHSAWDSLLIRTEMSQNPNRDGGFREYARDLIKQLPTDPADPKYASIEAGDPVQWAEESHHLAELNAYALIGPKLKTSPADNKKYQFYLVNREYRDKNIKIIDEQLVRAGIRLAAVLAKIFPDS